MFDWKWYLSEIRQDKDVKVFTTFSCGGGSSMGYKRAGFEVLGNVEIDPRMNEVYIANNHPKYNFLMDLRDFNKKTDIPDELYHLDILDGSPPCSTFSTIGLREKVWGKEKVFKEGQKKQVLDELFFIFLDTVKKLRPKIVVAENVTGLIKGAAKGYVSQIIEGFHELGYEVQLFQFNSSFMGVPQARERVFFIANNQGYPKLKMNFNGEPIVFGKVRSETGKPIKSEMVRKILQNITKDDRDLGDINKRIKGRNSRFGQKIAWDDRVAPTLVASAEAIRAFDKMYYSDEDCINVSSFPQDYDFLDQNPQYICGMSVPPNIMANIASEIYKQWLDKK